MSKANLGRQMSRRSAMLAQGARGLLLAALLAVGLIGGRPGSTAAQDATPGMATPDMATPTAECTPAAGDGAAMGGMDMASPEASPMASPAAAPVGTEADAETAAAVVAAAENVVACYNSGDVDAFLSLVTDSFIATSLGYDSRDEAATGLNAGGEEGIVPLEDFQADPDSVMTYDDGRASVDVTYTQFTYQYVAARWYFVMSGSDYLLDEEDLLVPEPEVDFVTVVSADVADDESAVVIESGASFPATDLIVIHIKNRTGTVAREFAVVQLPEGTMATPAAAEGETATVDQAALQAGTLVGYVLVGPGGEEDIALIDLPAGSYALVDFTIEAAVPFTIVEPAG